MFPYIDIFGFQLPTYGLTSLLGTFLAGFVIFRLSQKRGVDKLYLGFTAVAAGVGLFIGAHLLYGITRTQDIVQAFGSYSAFDGFFDFAQHIISLFSGMVFYGGLYGALGAGMMVAAKRKAPIGDMCDLFAVFAPLFHIFGRIGCFLAGCCYGVSWEYGISGRMVAEGVREHTKRFPVQLLEAGLLAVLFLVIYVLFIKGKNKGNLLYLYLAVYAVLRFFLEFLRGDEIRGRLWVFSTSQWISIITLLWVGIFLFVRKIKKQKT